MQAEIKTWLYDIKTFIEEIEDFLTDYTFERYTKELKTRRAVERNLTIIGEAMNRILSVDEGLPITKARKIVDTRNRFIHGYDKISSEVVWDIVRNHLPTLKSEVEQLLSQ